jgi:hypothetical protein
VAERARLGLPNVSQLELRPGSPLEPRWQLEVQWAELQHEATVLPQAEPPQSSEARQAALAR